MKAQHATGAAMSAVLLVSGCATSSKDIVGTSVSPTQYQSYDCGQRTEEANRIRVSQLGGRLDMATGPGRITDEILSTGRITLELGASGWVLVERNELPISVKPPLSSSPRLTGTTLRGVAAEISDSRLERVVELTANQAPIHGANDWSEEPCKLPDLLWTETYVRGFELPECIYVRKIRDFERLAAEGGLGAATAFAARIGVKPGSAYYEVTYARYVFSNFMRLSVYLPEARLQGDASAIAWAQRWAPAAKSLANGNGAVPLPR